MMTIGDFLHSKRWKLMQNYIYSWGASVVLIGALFKLEHLQFSGVFLGVGLSIEAIIFFVSGFEPMLEIPDWKTIYPQLRTGEEKERELERYKMIDKKYGNAFTKGGNGLGGGGIANLPEEQVQSLKESLDKLSVAANGISDITSATKATSEFVSNLNQASESIGSVVEANRKVSDVMDVSVQEMSQSYKTVAQKMYETVDNSSKGIQGTLKDLAGAITKSAEGLKGSSDRTTKEMEKTSAEFAQKMHETVDASSKGISGTLKDLNASVAQSAQGLKNSSDKVAKEMEKSSIEFNHRLSGAASDLNNSYKEMTNSLVSGFKGLGKSSGNYINNLDQLNKKLSSINVAYELHLKGTAKVESMVNEYAKGVGEIGKLLNTSVEQTERFNKNTKEINENIQALNTIYGRMLGALNGKK